MKLIIAGHNLLAFTEPKPKPIETITVKNRDAYDLAVLLDKFGAAEAKGSCQSNAAKIEFWMAAAKMYPQVKEGVWRIKARRLTIDLIREA